jgi:carboxypeptidase C (cathepsin A)
MTTGHVRWARTFALLTVSLAALPAVAQTAALGKYTTKAAFIPIGENPEKPTAEMFYTAHTLDGADPARRPVTFCFNGGPGAASVYMHMMAIGPMILEARPDGSFPSAPAKLAPNPHTWLHFTDLVFIDPVETGYSRATPGANGAPGDPGPFLETEADLRSIAQFIQRYLTQNDRWMSPKALAGESYGGMRVAALTKMLMTDYDINLNRAVLISPSLNSTLVGAGAHYELVNMMTSVPTLAAIAAAHGRSSLPADPAKLPQAIQAVEQYALGDFVTGLARLGRATPAEAEAFYARMSPLIGLDAKLLAQSRGRVSQLVFAKTLLRDRSQVIDRYDGRQASDDPAPEKLEFASFDKTLVVMNGVLSAPFIDYMRRTVGFRSDRSYIMLNLAANKRWKKSGDFGTPEDLAYALTLNTDLKAMVVHGYHDLATAYFESRYLLEQCVTAQSARQRLSFGTYIGGHMFYLNTKSREELFRDAAAFFK